MQAASQVLQIVVFWMSLCAVMTHVNCSPVAANQPIYSNSIQRVAEDRTNTSTESKPLKKVFLSNRSITCNDGSQAGFYLRKSPTSKKWIIFLEGGWYCYDPMSCRNRWIKQRHYMTSSKWTETKYVGGILSGDVEENPYWWNANHVFVPYCSSDSWSGSKKAEKQSGFSFMGSLILLQVVRDLIPLGLENSTDLLLTGSSAGGTGVMLNLDYVEELLHEQMLLKQIRVKGMTDSGWFLDRTPYAPTMKPAVDAIRKGMELWEGKVPRRCREQYLTEPWRCYFGYRLYPTLKTPLFVFQWLFDEAQMDADNVGAPVTKQQWDYIHKMGDALRHSFENVSAVFAPSCIAHSVLTKSDWQEVKIDNISIADALHCWVQKSNKKRIKRRKNNRRRKQHKNGKELRKKPDLKMENNMKRDDKATDPQRERNNKKKRRRERKQKERRRKKQNEENRLRDGVKSRTKNALAPPSIRVSDNRTRKSVSKQQKRLKDKHCSHRRLERCSWPQCNHSCPMLHNPFTGQQMDFIELLKSFGLDMESVANALGMDIETLNNMDHGDLLNLLTQQNN